MSMNEVGDYFRKCFGIGPGLALLIPVSLAAAAAFVAMLFPKVEATGLLQFPEAQKTVVEKPGEQAQWVPDPKANVIELAAFKRVAAAYDSVTQLGAYIADAGLVANPGTGRLLNQAEDAGFWSQVATPVLPFSRRDQREFGDIKDAQGTTILGLVLTVDARKEPIARDMLSTMASFYVNAVMRERIRAWTLSGKVDAQAQDKAVRADILKAEFDISMFGRRVEDMKSTLARYPDAARMDARQVVSVNQAEGGERYLSPLAQVVGAESAISQRRESIRRWQRDLKQKSVLAGFYSNADALVDTQVDVTKLLKDLRALAKVRFAHEEAANEWNQEAQFRVAAALDNFEVMRGQFGMRNGVRVAEIPSRKPTRLAAFGAAAGLALLGILAFVRVSLRAARPEHASGSRDLSHSNP